MKIRGKKYKWVCPEWMKFVGGMAVMAAISLVVFGICAKEIYMALFM